MKAWQFTGTNEPLVLNEIAEPLPGPGEVVLQIKAAGLCHSDVGALTDPSWLAVIPIRPVVMGHEVAGVVHEWATASPTSRSASGTGCGRWAPLVRLDSRATADSPTSIACRPAISCRYRMKSTSSWRRSGRTQA